MSRQAAHSHSFARRSTRPMSLNIRNSATAEDMILEDRESPTSDYNTCFDEGEALHRGISASTTFPTTILESDELAAADEG